MSIRKKLMTIISLLILIPLLVLGFFSYNKAASVLQENIIADHQALNTQMANGFINEFSGYTNGIKAIAENPKTKTLMENPQNEAEVTELFKHYVNNFSSAGKIFIGTQDKKMRSYPYTKYAADYDPTGRSWYLMAQNSETPIWTDIYTSASTGKLNISAACPVINSQNKQFGVVAIDFDLSILSEKVSKIKVGKEGYVCITDASGNVIAHPDTSLLGKPIGVKELMTVIENKERSGNFSYHYKDKDGKVADKYATFTYMPETRWYIVTASPYKEITDSTAPILFTTMTCAVFSLIIALVIAFLFSNSLTKPIQKLVSDMSKVAAGDMTIQSNIQTKDEIGVLSKNFDKMISDVRGFLESVVNVTVEVSTSAETLAASSEEVCASSDEITKTIEEIACGATDQAHDTEQAARVGNDLNDKFEQLHENSKQMSVNTEQVKKENESGAVVLTDLKIKADDNQASTKKITEAITDLELKSQDIGGILETISSISNQTNLLALNASIEAARAGEHGRGFAVVADEIRKLAEESGQSASQIRTIVNIIQEHTQNTVSLMSEFQENSQSQYKAVEAMDQSFQTISTAIENVTSQIQNIDESINDLINDKNTIVSSITNISSVSQQTAAASEEVNATMEQQNTAIESVAESAERLNELSKDLSDQLAKFRI